MISLEKYDGNILKHQNVIKELSYDKNVMSRIGSIIYINNLTYVIKNHEDYIGILKLNKELHNNYSIDMAIVENYRKNGYGIETLQKVKEYIEDYNKLLIRTRYDNLSGVNCSKAAGYQKDYIETEKCNDEGADYLVFSYTKK
jgi:RimJ/RimL family protein N-acetyltransferase